MRSALSAASQITTTPIASPAITITTPVPSSARSRIAAAIPQQVMPSMPGHAAAGQRGEHAPWPI